ERQPSDLVLQYRTCNLAPRVFQYCRFTADRDAHLLWRNGQGKGQLKCGTHRQGYRFPRLRKSSMVNFDHIGSKPEVGKSESSLAIRDHGAGQVGFGLPGRNLRTLYDSARWICHTSADTCKIDSLLGRGDWRE